MEEYKQVKRNKGARAPEIDGMNVNERNKYLNENLDVNVNYKLKKNENLI